MCKFPKQSDLSADSVDAIFSGADLDEWKDQEILEAYLAQIERDKGIYKAFLNKCYSLKLNMVQGGKGKVIFPSPLPLINTDALATVAKGTNITKESTIE